MSHPRSFWVTGASNGLGLAMAQRLLEQGHRVAASGNDCEEFTSLVGGKLQLLRLPGQLHQPEQAEAAIRSIQSTWGTLDSLVVNAGTTDYLTDDVADTDLFEAIASSNLLASKQCLAGALPLLAKGTAPQVMAIFSPLSALQLYAPTQVPRGDNSTPQWFREQRRVLQQLGIGLTVVAPQSLKNPVTDARAIPLEWTPRSVAEELLRRLTLREPELVLEALSVNSLWPLLR
ncbi:SDR family oxidoreductase [Pseudomonas putida]